MIAALRTALLELQRRDDATREELLQAGVLHEGYHPQMQAVHQDNARQLRELLAIHGWPNQTLAGEDGAEAAWLVAQHAISEPAFMRRCCALIQAEVAAAAAPLWQLAYLQDRICVSEGKPQPYGTQFEITPEGVVVCPLADAAGVDARRAQAGLEPLRKRLKALAREPRPTPAQFAVRKQAEAQFRLEVGWSASSG